MPRWSKVEATCDTTRFPYYFVLPTQFCPLFLFLILLKLVAEGHADALFVDWAPPRHGSLRLGLGGVWHFKSPP